MLSPNRWRALSALARFYRRRVRNGPVLRREGNLPKIRRRLQKFDAHLCFALGLRAQARDLAHLLRLRHAILHPQLLPFGHFFLEQNERPVEIHDERMRLLFEGGVSRSVFRAHGDGHRKDYPLTASTGWLGAARNLAGARHLTDARLPKRRL